ncbi:hypothetical protein ACFQ4Y_10200 [Kroppenstedtia sanguinis]|uniref:Uncharacterized protein n=1 Tax=Kroppenstedtia sanguinis TaxID=1380684 RepID=A0ABW4CAY7_9BACL
MPYGCKATFVLQVLQSKIKVAPQVLQSKKSRLHHRYYNLNEVGAGW